MDPDEWTLSEEYNTFCYDSRENSSFHFSGQKEWLQFFNICYCTGSESWDNSSLLQHGGVVINTLNDDYQETLSYLSWFSDSSEATFEHLILIVKTIANKTQSSFLLPEWQLI